MFTRIPLFALISMLAIGTGLSPATAFADRGEGYRQKQLQQQRVESQKTRRIHTQLAERRIEHRDRANEHRVAAPHASHRVHVGPPHTSYRTHWRAVPRQRYYRGIPVYRHYGHRYPGFGYYYRDADAYPWIAFTVLSMAIINQLGEPQQRLHEQAFVRATSANAGDTIYWQDEQSSGSIVVQAIWYDRRGRQCRNLEQTVHHRSFSETGHATVCLRDNGAWEVTRSDHAPIR